MNARNPNLAEWLIPTLAQGMERDENGIRDEEGPDFFAVGFQEMIPLVSLFFLHTLLHRIGN